MPAKTIRTGMPPSAITPEEYARIQAFLDKPVHAREIDDLLPDDDE